ncbi:Versiconal hemiacetal acetate esterase [Colletotrichum trifolii]|uniref:Versiconal hemiacetal acetate esterase n=1 Tax=Colletotrichum trifolii TaxID=5466 RepID=A0A4V3HU50_COLTR|nr:Versiconal hemiacetal acetate esterase [Colletotrichum trifolii]
MESLGHLVLGKPPLLNGEWLKFEKDTDLEAPEKKFASPLERQPVYAEECRRRNAAILITGAKYHHLAKVTPQLLTATSSLDNAPIPLLCFSEAGTPQQAGFVILYLHGGGLMVGEADSEELSCRRIAHDLETFVISVGYRLMPTFPASTCLSDAIDAFEFVKIRFPGQKIVLVGSSSGGQLAAAVSQTAKPGCLGGVVLRCPVTSDAGTSLEYVPESLRGAHTSATADFETTLLPIFKRAVPRDGLPRLPLEAGIDELKATGLPRTWIQVCTNDTLYSDGLCYAMLLRQAGVEVQVDVVEGWPHTFWLKAPQLEGAEAAERKMMEGLKWVLEG